MLISYGMVNKEIFHKGDLFYDFWYNRLVIWHILNDIILHIHSSLLHPLVYFSKIWIQDKLLVLITFWIYSNTYLDRDTYRVNRWWKLWIGNIWNLVYFPSCMKWSVYIFLLSLKQCLNLVHWLMLCERKRRPSTRLFLRINYPRAKYINLQLSGCWQM